MAPPPPFGANSAAARDIANVLHPYTDLQAHQQAGPIVIARGKGVRVWDESGKDDIVVFDPATEHMETVAIPTRGSVVRNMSLDSTRGRLWLALSGTQRLGRIDVNAERR